MKILSYLQLQFQSVFNTYGFRSFGVVIVHKSHGLTLVFRSQDNRELFASSLSQRGGKQQQLDLQVSK